MGSRSSNHSSNASPPERPGVPMRLPLLLALLCAPAACLSQDQAHTIAPGMSESQVVQALGKPATRRAVGERTYLFYVNSCGRRCGMNDLVVLARDSVVDAIFRS